MEQNFEGMLYQKKQLVLSQGKKVDLHYEYFYAKIAELIMTRTDFPRIAEEIAGCERFDGMLSVVKHYLPQEVPLKVFYTMPKRDILFKNYDFEMQQPIASLLNIWKSFWHRYAAIAPRVETMKAPCPHDAFLVFIPILQHLRYRRLLMEHLTMTSSPELWDAYQAEVEASIKDMPRALGDICRDDARLLMNNREGPRRPLSLQDIREILLPEAI